MQSPIPITQVWVHNKASHERRCPKCTHKRWTDELSQNTGAVQFRQAQAGCRDCLNELMERHDGLVHAVARLQVLGDLPYDEAVQGGRIGLWRTVKKVERFLVPSLVICADSSLKAENPAVVWETSAIHDALHELVERQPTRLRYIITARYGLDGCAVAFYREIGEHLHLSGERVRQLHTEALVRLRHSAHSQHLRSLLDYHTVADY